MEANIGHYIQRSEWSEILAFLRDLLLDCGLQEAWKWDQPTFMYNNSNVMIIAGYKTDCVLSFFKGVLLKDEAGILEKPGPFSQSVRVVRFTTLKQATALEATLKAYVFETIANEKAGLKVDFDKTAHLDWPEELHAIFEDDLPYHKAFQSLTAGRQRGYLVFWKSGKQAATRTNRIQKNRERILQGFGMNDCTCGLSKRKPSCDGSHRQLDGFETL